MATELEKLEDQFTRYEIARILGARALQIAMDAPLLLKLSEQELEEINFNPIEIAKKELIAGVLPITVNRPMPKKKETKLKVLSKEEIESLRKKKEEEDMRAEDIDVEKDENEKKPLEAGTKEDDKEEKEFEGEVSEEKKVTEDDEIMELSTPEDEFESEGPESEETEI